MVGTSSRAGRELGDAQPGGAVERAGCSVVESLERRVLMAAGVLDTTFNGTGKQTAKYRSNNDGVAVAVQGDGKIVVVGDTEASGGTKDAFVSRYNADGSVDTAFANGGVAFLERGFDEIATGVAVQNDGKIVVVGVIGTLSALQGNAFVARYNPDGSADTTFNGTGSKTIDFGGGDAATGVAVTPQGRIIVVGTSFSGVSSGIAVAFLNPDGSFETTFGTGTVVQSPGVGVFEAGTGVALAPDAGRFYVSGVSFSPSGSGARFMVAEFNMDGSPTTAFGNQGRAFASFGRRVELATGVAVDPTSNKVVAAGTSADGVIEFAPGFPAANLPSTAATQADFAVARFNTDGTLDPTFGSGGKTTTDFRTGGASNLDGASDVVVQADGKVVAGGGSQIEATGNSQFATARYTTGGALDGTWGAGGRTVTSFGASDGSFGMALQADQKVVEAGHTKVSASNSSVAIVRYTSNGTSPGPVPGTTSISVNNVTVPEPTSGTGTANFVVSLSQASTNAVTVDFATADGTAQAGQDYTAASGTLTFAPGETSKTVSVQVLTDGTTAEGSETFSLNLSNPTNATVATGTGTGTITEGQVLVPGINVTKVNIGQLPKRVVGGQPNAQGPVTVTLLNNTNAAVRAPVRIRLFGSTDQVAEPSTDLKLGSAKPTVQIAAHGRVTVTVNAKFPRVPANERLFVVAVAKGPAVSSSSGVQGSSTSTVRVLQAKTKLVGSTRPQARRAVTYNQVVNVTAPLTNKGNVAANGTVRLAALVSTDGTDNPNSIVLASTLPRQAVHLNVNQTGQFLFSFRTPRSSSQLAPGNYTLLIKLTKAKVQGATNTTDGSTIAVVPFTIA